MSKSATAGGDALHHYDRLIATVPPVERKGATMPYPLKSRSMTHCSPPGISGYFPERRRPLRP
jgi:hypothetical protein